MGHKLLFFNTIAQGAGNKELISQAVNTWNRILSLTYGVDVEEVKMHDVESMTKEYDKIKHLRPKFQVQPDGKIVISGLGNLEKSKGT